MGYNNICKLDNVRVSFIDMHKDFNRKYISFRLVHTVDNSKNHNTLEYK